MRGQRKQITQRKQLFFRGKKSGTLSKHAKKPKNAKKTKIVGATTVCRRLPESEAGDYIQVKQKQGQTKVKCTLTPREIV